MAQKLDTTVTAPESTAVKVLPEDKDAKGARRVRQLLTIVLIVLILLLLVACGALYALLRPGAGTQGKSVKGIEWIRSVYGFGVNPNQLMFPTSVAVTPDGQSFWVADCSNVRLIEYSMNGHFKRLVTKGTTGKTFNSPNCIAVAPNGWIYVAEQSYDDVLVYDSGFHLKQTLQIELPSSLAINNNMLVIGSRGGFAAFKLDGTLIGQVGKWGTGDDSFDMVGGVALDKDSNLYVTDVYNNRLSKYDAQGDRVWMVKLGQPGNAGIDGGSNIPAKQLEKKYPANLQVPTGVTLDGNNRVIVIDMFDYSVSAFSTSNGKFLGKWGEYGTEDGFFSNPSAIVYNRQQNVFLECEPAVGRVQIFRLANSSSNGLSSLASRYSDLFSACLIPLLVLLILLAIYIITRVLVRRRRNAGKDVVELES